MSAVAAGLGDYFAASGALARGLASYEPRPAQAALARGVERALSTRGHLLAEAGTGTGKSLAYLVPAARSGLRVVVSTATKALQEQLLRHDIPLVSQTLAQPINVQLMKGRTNYACQVRAKRYLAQGVLGTSPWAPFIDRLRAWLDESEVGDRAELTGLPEDLELWSELTANHEQCTGRRCEKYEACFVTQMRRQAQSAQLVIVNHHLYFADLALRQLGDGEVGGLLPAHDAVIFDEAHEVAEVAAQHFGVAVSERRVRDLTVDVSKGIGGDALLAGALTPLLGAVELESRRLFDALPFAQGRRLLQPELDEAVRTRFETLASHVADVEQALMASADAEITILGRRAGALLEDLAWVLDAIERPDDTPLVRYMEQQGRTRLLVARPLDVSELVGAALREHAAVLVSATLQSGGSFAQVKQDLGLPEAEELCLDSPFDFEAQTRLFVPEDAPDPGEPRFAEYAAHTVRELVHASGGGALVLCTSLRMVQVFREALAQAAPLLLVQGQAPKEELLARFRAHGHAVLVASMGFWQGVDVPGAALRLVVMDKLPFAAPSDPLVQARAQYLESQGRDPFWEMQLPQAATSLRQGFGRLIRHHDDRGLVVLLDSRVLKRRYGAQLLASLPGCPRLGRLEEATAFLMQHAGAAP